MKTILCVLLLTGTMFADFTLHYTDVTTVNPDGTLTVTPTVELAGVDDISLWSLGGDCIDAWNTPAIVVSGNHWYRIL
jgi:hypothetical protein